MPGEAGLHGLKSGLSDALLHLSGGRDVLWSGGILRDWRIKAELLQKLGVLENNEARMQQTKRPLLLRGALVSGISRLLSFFFFFSRSDSDAAAPPWRYDVIGQGRSVGLCYQEVRTLKQSEADGHFQ